MDPTLWRNLLSVQHRRDAELGDIERLLELWASARGATEAALYTPDGARLIAGSGEGRKKLILPGEFVLTHDADLLGESDISTESLLIGCAAGIFELKEKLDESKFFALSQGVELMALYEVGLAIASILDLEGLVDELLSRALMLLEVSRGALYRREGEKYFLARARGEAPTELEDVGALLDGNTSSDLLPGVRHVLAVPVGSEERRSGILVIGSDEALTAKDRRTLSLFANQAAIALEKVRLHELAIEKERQDKELEIAAEIQQQLLPDEMPEIPGFEVLGWSRPARVVGGDYFTFHDHGDDEWTLVIGDVSGKGSPAALLVCTIDSALRVMLDGSRLDSELVRRLNQLVYEASTGNKYVTMILTRLDGSTGRLEFVNAGHNDGLLIRAGGEVERLESVGTPVGLLPRARYEKTSVELAVGDLVCLYSDGITECEDARGEEFGESRLVELLLEHRSLPLERLEATLNDTVEEFSAGQPQGDDQTVVLVRRR